MLSLLPVDRVITVVAVAYAVTILLVVAIILTVFPSLSPWQTLTVAFSGATALQLLVLLVLNVAWKWVWSAIPALNQLLFPNIEGKWKMVIHWQREDRSGQVTATAVIRQTLLKLSMEVFSEGSESETLVALPRRDQESGRPMLYYVYRVVPKADKSDAGHPYEGSALLKLADKNTLSGNYFTSQSTRGRFSLTRAGAK
ncbi:MAG TPA: hypothetical protein VGV07_12425 [Devosia sp.]|jgi:hypothetical protein|uniref:Cap15 family cyclic dinucleotide receptor domain-containing protein n=1 Tax=Devosia sp. TaxID=1871048 RepID=UPI002DDD1A0A|nr:hypothetical protein [Devosia sp.]HEV2516050.1 hypothetical protein [Devosia sp.]